jgi:hypothetical protein
MGYSMGRSGRGGDMSTGAAILAGGAIVVLLGGFIAGACVFDKQTKEAKAELNKTVAATMNYKSADVTYFDWLNDNDNEYIFKFTGNAINMNDEKIDFFSCSYAVSEKQYYDVLTYIEKNDVEDLDSKNLLEKLTGIIKEAEVVKGKENANVTTSADDTNRVILNVSKAKVNGDKVSYYVSYVKEERDANGNLGLTTVLDEISYDLTDELAKNPNGVFALDAKDANVRVLGSEFAPMNVGNVQVFGNSKTQTKSRM